MFENDKEFNARTCRIDKKFTPKSSNIVTFHNLKTEQRGVGVVRMVYENTGEVIMYCYYIKGESVKYSMNESLGMIDDFSFIPVEPNEYPRKALETELAKVGKTWNHHVKRIEPLGMKLTKGEHYWYISDKMKVVIDTEKDTPTSHNSIS